MAETPPRLIVVMAFDPDEEGELRPAFEPAQFDSEARAERYARSIAHMHDAVIAWSREAHPDVGEYGEPNILFQKGDVPEME